MLLINLCICSRNSSCINTVHHRTVTHANYIEIICGTFISFPMAKLMTYEASYGKEKSRKYIQTKVKPKRIVK